MSRPPTFLSAWSSLDLLGIQPLLEKAREVQAEIDPFNEAALRLLEQTGEEVADPRLDVAYRQLEALHKAIPATANEAMVDRLAAIDVRGIRPNLH